MKSSDRRSRSQRLSASAPARPRSGRCARTAAQAVALTIALAIPLPQGASERLATALPAPTVAAARTAWPLRQALAQTPRPIPADARLGALKLGVFPQAVLDGKAIVLGPGFRLFDLDNRIMVPSTVSGTWAVAYVAGPVGELTQAWILSDAERVEWLRRIANRRGS